MQSDDNSFISQFEIEGEDQVRRNVPLGIYGARGNSVAFQWLEQKSRDRKARAAEARRFDEHQARTAETANQLSERQAKLAESANRLANDANRLSKWAIIISIVGCILAAAAILYDHA